MDSMEACENALENLQIISVDYSPFPAPISVDRILIN
jgi:hypothetical protein